MHSTMYFRLFLPQNSLSFANYDISHTHHHLYQTGYIWISARKTPGVFDARLALLAVAQFHDNICDYDCPRAMMTALNYTVIRINRILLRNHPSSLAPLFVNTMPTHHWSPPPRLLETARSVSTPDVSAIYSTENACFCWNFRCAVRLFTTLFC